MCVAMYVSVDMTVWYMGMRRCLMWPGDLSDSAPSPGKLSADQIKSGYVALKAIEDCINRGNLGDPLVRACENFYTRIPHCFGYIY